MMQQTYTIGLPNGQGPAVISVPLNSPDRQDFLTLEAWIGNFGSSNVYIMEGDVKLTEAQGRIGQPPGDALDRIDCLLTLSGSTPSRVGIDAGIRRLTVFFESANTSGTTEAVTIRVTELKTTCTHCGRRHDIA